MVLKPTGLHPVLVTVSLQLFCYAGAQHCVVRGACPGMNTLANHGYLPHDGKNITLQRLLDAMLEGYNVNGWDTVLLYISAVQTNPLGVSARSFSLTDLTLPGTSSLDHDASLRYVEYNPAGIIVR